MSTFILFEWLNDTLKVLYILDAFMLKLSFLGLFCVVNHI